MLLMLSSVGVLRAESLSVCGSLDVDEVLYAAFEQF